MITQSGIHIQKIGGADGTPTPMDIAVHMARICRFGGAVWYPLLPHSVFVGLMAIKRSGSIGNMLWGFLHDAHEVATSDVPRPFKCDCLRAEQEAIDLRLYNKYMQWAGVMVDQPTIKQCDIDACDIEAVEMNLPNYEEITAVHGVEAYAKYKPEVHADAEDVALLRRILASPFYADDIIKGRSSRGVLMFARVLELAERGDYAAIGESVKGWNLL